MDAILTEKQYLARESPCLSHALFSMMYYQWRVIQVTLFAHDAPIFNRILKEHGNSHGTNSKGTSVIRDVTW
jgi:hypothetical protein